ncbi:hypothetical protein [Streptomyces chrestomyceticus]|uniref:hypothetical protein n=1 Tax=Streptomyces chrestomyceticus TaxID=68185 RepID=UPI0037B8DB0C
MDDYWICARPWRRKIRKDLDAEPFGGRMARMPVFGCGTSKNVLLGSHGQGRRHFFSAEIR